ncbi:hypothetical protein BaRGS_00039433 [Batillaria attramentaria]|uniref:Uncharacterized protein n=1 Tax=Batillaria attramentaria TaxID=370345 RepID=A0ABD0J351_9CAEN
MWQARTPDLSQHHHQATRAARLHSTRPGSFSADTGPNVKCINEGDVTFKANTVCNTDGDDFYWENACFLANDRALG